MTAFDELTREQKIVLVDIALNSWASGQTWKELLEFEKDNPWVREWDEFCEWLADNAADTMVDGIDVSWEEYRDMKEATPI